LKYNYEKPVDWEHETALFKKLKENAHTSWMSWSMLKDNSNK
jgi:hypothetical protein